MAASRLLQACAASWGNGARSPLSEPLWTCPENALAMQAPLIPLVIKQYVLIPFNVYNFRNTLTYEKWRFANAILSTGFCVLFFNNNFITDHQSVEFTVF